MIITAWSGVLPKGKIQAGAARAFDMAGSRPPAEYMIAAKHRRL